jgi:hypothetical protein
VSHGLATLEVKASHANHRVGFPDMAGASLEDVVQQAVEFTDMTDVPQKEISKMEVSSSTVRGILSRMWTRLRGNDLAQKYAGDELSLRSELFSADQMEQHGKIVAGSHQLKPGRHRDCLLARLGGRQSGPSDYTSRGMVA